jgi:hypothetical protein
MRLHELKSVTAVYNLEIKVQPKAPEIATFRKWVGNGMKFASLAGAGKH